MWKLKEDQPSFEMVDGPMAGRGFAHGQEYAAVPESEQHRFAHTGEAIIDKLAENDAKQPRKGRKDEEVANA